MKKHLLGKGTALALSALMLFTLTPGVAMAEETNAESETQNSVEINTLSEPATGACNENVSWSLDSDGTLTITGDGDMNFDWDGDYNICPWEDYSASIKTVVIEEGVTNICSNAFDDCINLTSVTFAEDSQLKNIGERAFYDCEKLKSIEIPASVLSIGEYALGFYYEYYYDENTEKWVDDDYAKVADFAISGYTNSAADSYATDNGMTFNSVGTVNLDDEIASGNNGDDISWSLNRGGTLTITGDGDVESDAYLKDYIGIIKNIIFDEGVTSIENYAFFGYNKLTSITIPSSVTSIGYEAFRDCYNLTSVTFAENSQLKTIGEEAFYNCEKLKSIEIPENVYIIGEHALGFYYKSYYEENTEKWVYDDYAKVADFVISGYTNSVAYSYATDNGITFNSVGTIDLNEEIASGNCGDDGDNVKWSLNRGGTLTISGSGDMEFLEECNVSPWEDYSEFIKTVEIEEGITSIKSFAFSSGCSSLTSVKISGSVTSIGEGAFAFAAVLQA